MSAPQSSAKHAGLAHTPRRAFVRCCRNEHKEVPWYRIDELASATKLVMVVNRFASMRAVVPELFEGLETRGKWDEESLATLDGAHLATLAWSYARVGLGSPSLFARVTAAADKTTLPDHDRANLDWAVAQQAVRN